MLNEPSAADPRRMPGLYDTSRASLEEITIYEHFSSPGGDWYFAEHDPSRQIFYGYQILRDEIENARWVYVTLAELRARSNSRDLQLLRDPNWTPRKASEVARIVEVYRRHRRASRAQR